MLRQALRHRLSKGIKAKDPRTVQWFVLILIALKDGMLPLAGTIIPTESPNRDSAHAAADDQSAPRLDWF